MPNKGLLAFSGSFHVSGILYPFTARLISVSPEPVLFSVQLSTVGLGFIEGEADSVEAAFLWITETWFAGLEAARRKEVASGKPPERMH